ncbi:MAG TPA: S8 family peptidase, partial [Acidimicrobiia bacterium]|nr:S8 family peptidase [Acidimicrobiia bacterium]
MESSCRRARQAAHRGLAAGSGLLLIAVLLARVPGAAGSATLGSAGAEGGTYLVRFVDGADAPAVAAALARDGGRVGRVYEHVFPGAALRLSDQAAAALRRHPRVAAVERDGPVRLAETQTQAPWGLDRTDQRDLPLSGTYAYPNTGAGVTAYIVDSGIRSTHVDFGGRVRGGYTAVNDGAETNDCLGHGTHVAGTLGGSTYGVAKAVSLVSVRIFDCNAGAEWSGILGGLDWIVADHDPGEPAVVNMSLVGPATSLMDTAVEAMIADGLTVVASAGNDGQDACLSSPARTPAAVTVAATDTTDRRTGFSNWGPCVDLFAPGVNVLSAGSGSDTATAVLSGTSMSAPHAAGAAAVLLAADPSLGPAGVAAALAANATTGLVASRGSGSPNRLLHSPPPRLDNDDFSAASTFALTGPSPLAGANAGATREPGEPDHAGVAGDGSVWWAFTAPSGG